MPDEWPPPTDFYRSTLDWVQTTNVKEWLYEIYPEIKIPNVKRKAENKIIEWKPQYSNKAFAAVVPGGRVLSDRAVISPDNKLLHDVSVEWMTPPEQHSIFREEKLPPVTVTDETVAMLNHPAGYNYYHWMLEALARIHLIERTKIKIDKYIVNHRSLPFQLESLAACGIPPERIIVPHADFHLMAKQLIVPSYVNLPNVWSCKYVRDLFLKRKRIRIRKKYERIYIMRDNRRKVVNEDEILHRLQKHGFQGIRLESMPLRKQIKIFRSAKIVVAAHGAGLANLVFCRPGTRVLELFAPNYIEPHYWLISRLMKLDYRFMIGETANPNLAWTGLDDMYIDGKAMMKKLRRRLI